MKASKSPVRRITRSMAQEMIGNYLRLNIDLVVTKATGDSQDQEEKAAVRQAILAEANRMDPDGVQIDT